MAGFEINPRSERQAESNNNVVYSSGSMPIFLQVTFVSFLFCLSIVAGFAGATYFWFSSDERKSDEFQALVDKIDQLPKEQIDVTNIEFLINDNAKSLLAIKDKLEEIKLRTNEEVKF